MGILSRLLDLGGSSAEHSTSLDPFLGAANPTRNPSCGEFEVDGWVTSAFVARILVPVAGVHPFPLQELMLMTATVCRFQPSLIFEWGTNIGKSARIFHEIAQYFHIRTTIHSCDLPDDVDHVEHPHDQRGAMVRGLAGVELHQGDGLTTSLRLWERAGRPPGPLFFLDGDHSHASVRREIDGILAAIPYPVLLLHDTFLQSPDSGYNIGPRQAVEESLAAFPGRFQSVHSGLSLPGMTLLYSIAPFPA
jgi:cephalosporin hydroxylase